jgi:hypothetical protein
MDLGLMLKKQKFLIKAATKAPNPILHEARGFTYTHTSNSRFFGYRKTAFFG